MLERSGGDTKDVTLEDADWLIQKKLVSVEDRPSVGFKLSVTRRGQASLKSTPTK